ncbi:MAG: fatty acid desaturase [Chitinophagaceae bacterium]
MSKITFNNKQSLFYATLKKNVDQYFSSKEIKKTGNWALYSKTVILIPATILIYVLLLTVSMPAVLAIFLSAVVGALLASIGFNVMHDACHGSYSSKKWMNNLLGHSLNALGGNAFLWKQKHNIIHHTYTNIEGADDDISMTKLLRQSPTQKWSPIHRFQHIYLPFVYSMTIFMWVGFSDYNRYFTKKINNTPLQSMDAGEHIIFWISKVLYMLFYVVIPILCVGWQAWLVGYVTMGIVVSVILAYTFQLAHSVEGPEFDSVGIDDKMIDSEWAIHQVKTTANFAPKNKLVNWFVGGLNYQVEHHLFPRISHIHYPAISHIVERTCKQFNLPYHSFRTVTESIVSHTLTMKKLGQKPVTAI